MKPVYWLFAIVLGVGLACAWTYWQRAEDSSSTAFAQVRSSSAGSARVMATEASPQPAHASKKPTSSEDEVARWLMDVDSTDAAKRAAAIKALANAPRSQALPALRRVLLNGEPVVDRPLALQVLRALALSQGDGDAGVRQAFREVIYHGDDDSLAAGAQEALDVVESAEQKIAQR